MSVLQLAFISHANLMVKHSADSAARAAIVVLPDDPNEYGGEPEMSLDRNPVTASDLGVALGQIGVCAAGSSKRSRPPECLLPEGSGQPRKVTPQHDSTGRPYSADAVGADERRSRFAPEHRVRPSEASGSSSARSTISRLRLPSRFRGFEGGVATEPEITVRVTYAYQCTVPLARRILCQSFADLDAQEELGEAFLPLAQSLVGGRFRSLQHETTLHDP